MQRLTKYSTDEEYYFIDFTSRLGTDETINSVVSVTFDPTGLTVEDEEVDPANTKGIRFKLSSGTTKTEYIGTAIVETSEATENITLQFSVYIL